MEVMDRLFTRDDLCKELGISSRTCYDFLKSLKERFPDEKSLNRYIGKRQRFTKNDMERIVELSCLKSSNVK